MLIIETNAIQFIRGYVISQAFTKLINLDSIRQEANTVSCKMNLFNALKHQVNSYQLLNGENLNNFCEHLLCSVNSIVNEIICCPLQKNFLYIIALRELLLTI